VLAVVVGVASERRWPARTSEIARRTLVLTVYTVLPVVIFFNLARASFTRDEELGLGLVYVAVAITGTLAVITSKRLNVSRPARGSILTSSVMGNTGYLGLPLTAALLGFEQIPAAVLYDTVVTTPLLFLGAFGVGAVFGDTAGETVGERLKVFFTRNPPLYAAIAGLLAPASLAPDIAVDISRVLIVALLPIGFFAVGAALAEEQLETAGADDPDSTPASIGLILISKLIVMPLVLWAISLPLLDLPDTYLLLAAMPCGINALIVAHLYGLDHRLTAKAVTWTTAIVLVVALTALALL
jgi:predicted permease